MEAREDAEMYMGPVAIELTSTVVVVVVVVVAMLIELDMSDIIHVGNLHCFQQAGPFVEYCRCSESPPHKLGH